MSVDKFPMTAAIRALRAGNVPFVPYLYDYEEHGGTARASAELGVDEHAVIKTLVFEDEKRKPLIILMHGDREVGPGLLAKAIGAKSVTPCRPEIAQKHTGYLLGGTSPFGTRTPMPVYVEKTIFDLPLIHINGGKRGFLVALDPQALRQLLRVQEVESAVPRLDS